MDVGAAFQNPPRFLGHRTILWFYPISDTTQLSRGFRSHANLGQAASPEIRHTQDSLSRIVAFAPQQHNLEQGDEPQEAFQMWLDSPSIPDHWPCWGHWELESNHSWRQSPGSTTAGQETQTLGKRHAQRGWRQYAHIYQDSPMVRRALQTRHCLRQYVGRIFPGFLQPSLASMYQSFQGREGGLQCPLLAFSQSLADA